MMERISASDLISRMGDIPEGGRKIIGIAGPPGSGKSTFAAALELELNTRCPGYAAVVPMDGFHFDDLVLVPGGLRSRKGAPETFDVDGFLHMLSRLRVNQPEGIAVPLFDRSLEVARAGARIVPRSVRAVIVEGNYLLLDREKWHALHFDISVMLNVPRDVLRQRLIDRWAGYGKSASQISAQVDANDMLNVDLVIGSSRPAQFVIEQG